MKALLKASTQKPRESRVSKGNKAENTASNGQAAIPADHSNQGRGLSGNGFEKTPDNLDPSDSTGVKRHEQIEELAYNLYLQRGMEPGYALQDWLEAEKQVLDPHCAGKISNPK